ncbi:hypothetical protein CDL15_Pgr005199 [Punica granatum]|uniref:RRM domain-containing protein n=1 Tax=Punica granatum TaxID=22663 RepID=A0A218WQ56_PUNGR|nr:hypothetical protein CDL15_Pgr005199 [Punica granatum]
MEIVTTKKRMEMIHRVKAPQMKMIRLQILFKSTITQCCLISLEGRALLQKLMGIAYIQYAVPESAARALEEVDNSIFQGRLLHVMPAKRKGQPEKQNDHSSNQAAKTFKQQREEERKASEASGDTRAWNTLFMCSDSDVENIARKLGVSKRDFLERKADDLAVRIALGETQVINETKKALAEAGVNVAAQEEFAAIRSDSAKRSNHVLLVKNLPYGCSGAELANMFGKYSSLDKVILPPTKTMALVFSPLFANFNHVELPL